MDAIGGLFQRLIDAIAGVIPAIVTPDWAALIRLLPLMLLPLVALWLLSTGGIWTLVGITKRGARIAIVDEPPSAAERDRDGTPIYPVGRPYDAAAALVYPTGSVRGADGRSLLLACPGCRAVRLAELAACSGCGLEMRYRPVARIARPQGPPPDGAARA